MAKRAKKLATKPSRRGQPRVNVPLWEHISFSQGAENRAGFIRNIGKGGMFIETEVPFEKNTEIVFSFHLKISDQDVSGRGRVCWVRPAWGNPLQPPGMGIEIVAFNGESAERFAQYFKQCLKQSPEPIDL